VAAAERFGYHNYGIKNNAQTLAETIKKQQYRSIKAMRSLEEEV